MLLILSARTVNEDIALHYGRMPPSFLPLGNLRLFMLQAELSGGAPVAMTVPEDFEISPVDHDAILQAGIRLLPQPTGLSLTQAIRTAVETLAPDGALRLLYGDTLVRMPEGDAQLARDRVVVQNTTSNYPWAYVVDAEGSFSFSDAPPRQLDTRQVVCGDYTFCDPNLLIRACAQSSITDALNTYHATRPFDLVEARDWFDFGHLPLYFQSKKQVMIKRVFNDLTYEDHMLVKQSRDTAKIRAEAHWYENLPFALQIHTPRYQGRIERAHRAGYGLEYLYNPLLSDLAAFGALPLSSWLEILNACFEFASKCHDMRPEAQAPESSPEFAQHFFDKMIISKTWDRLEGYCAAAGLSLDDEITLNGTKFAPLRAVVENVITKIPPTTQDHIRFWHGDMFYGNMFYDFTARRVLAIDPRGQLGPGETCLFGDWRYDIAKLAHSVVGQYDRIILGRTSLHENGPLDWQFDLNDDADQANLESIFLSQTTDRYDVGPETLVAMTALLFFSMLPLHSDRPDLQRQMLANALRLAARLRDKSAVTA